jgi:hypothetical protein
MNETHRANDGGLLTRDMAFMLQGFVHDLNNLFTCVLGNLGIAQNCADDGAEVQLRLGAAKTAALQATQFASLMMRLCGGSGVDKEPRDLAELVEETAGIVRAGTDVRIEMQSRPRTVSGLHQCGCHGGRSFSWDRAADQFVCLFESPQ